MPHRFHFSLRSLFILMLLVAAFFAGVAVQRHETDRVRRMADEERDRAQVERELARASEMQARAMLEQMRAEAVERAEGQGD